jgi:hypothetical protein
MRRLPNIVRGALTAAFLVSALVASSGPSAAKAPPVPRLTITVIPNPLIESGISEIRAVVQVTVNPAFADNLVEISSTSLAQACGGAILFGSQQAGAIVTGSSIQVVFDNDGRVLVTLYGINCAPGKSLIEASMPNAPFATATTILKVVAPHRTKSGLTAFPNNEIETGDGPSSNSDVYTVFFLSFSPVYAEQSVQINSQQLFARCGLGTTWFSNNGTFAANTATATIDNDGNATFFFLGASCAAGKSKVIATVLAGNHPGFSSTYIIRAPIPVH